MADPSNLIAQAPPGIDPAEYARIMREQALAQIEEQYALSPATVQQPQGGGRFYQAARVSPLSGLSRIVSAVMAARGLKSSDQANAQMMAESLRAFQPGGAVTSQASAGPPASSTDGSPVPQASAAAPPQATQAPTNPLNPLGQDPRALWRLYMSDPAKYLDMVKGTPEWQTALMANGGNVTATQAALKAKLAKEGVIANRPGEESMIPDASAPGGYRTLRTPNISPNQDFTRDAHGNIVETHAIPGAAGAQGEMLSAETAAREANTPHLVKDEFGREVWQTPKLAPPAGAPGAPPPQGGPPPPTGPQAAPGGPQAPPKDPPVQGPKNYFATGQGSSQTTAGEESQKSGAKGGQEYSADLAKDAQGALDVHRSLAEMRNLARVASPSTANTMKGQVGTMMMGMGMDPVAVSTFLGVDPGALQAATKQNAHLAQSSTKMVTSRGTNFDLDTFMKNNPNLGMTPGGFARVIDFMDKLTEDTMDKQKDFQAFKRAGGPNGTPIPPEEWEAEHTAHWTQVMRDKIKAGQTNSRKPLTEILGPPAGGTP